MMKYWLAGAAAFALMSGAALAQSVSTQSTTTVTTPAPVVNSYSSTRTQHSTDSNGNTTDKTSSYQSGPDGSKAMSKSQTVAPDGSVQSTVKEKRVDPMQGSTYEKQTTTTTDR
jgi:hypothetical protein